MWTEHQKLFLASKDQRLIPKAHRKRFLLPPGSAASSMAAAKAVNLGRRRAVGPELFGQRIGDVHVIGFLAKLSVLCIGTFDDVFVIRSWVKGIEVHCCGLVFKRIVTPEARSWIT